MPKTLLKKKVPPATETMAIHLSLISQFARCNSRESITLGSIFNILTTKISQALSCLPSDRYRYRLCLKRPQAGLNLPTASRFHLILPRQTATILIKRPQGRKGQSLPGQRARQLAPTVSLDQQSYIVSFFSIFCFLC